MSDKLKLGIIGVGNMGSSHLRDFTKGNWPEIEVTCVADIDEKRLDYAKEQAPGVKCFGTATELIHSGLCEAVIIATPHYFHPPIAIAPSPSRRCRRGCTS